MLAVAFIAGFAMVAPTLAMVSGTVTQITINTADQLDPAISGSNIVWTDSRNGNKDIYVYNIPSGTEGDLTPGTPSDQYLEDIDRVNVVYTHITGSGTDIFLHDISTSTTTPLTTGGTHYSPAVEGDQVDCILRLVIASCWPTSMLGR
jgi:beta propeller repeat protein